MLKKHYFHVSFIIHNELQKNLLSQLANKFKKLSLTTVFYINQWYSLLSSNNQFKGKT